MDPETQQPASTPPAPTAPETPPAPTAEAIPSQTPDTTPEESPESVNESVQEATTEPAPVAPITPVTPPSERVYTQSDRAKSLARKLEKKEAVLTALLELARTQHELTVQQVETAFTLKKSTARSYLETLVKRELLTTYKDGRTLLYRPVTP